ncbi:carbon-nitrogen hydrolase [Aspergillus similis]
MAIRIAACHASPIFFSASKTTSKAISLIHAAARNNAQLVRPPSPTENHELFQRMVAESVYADGDEIAAVRGAARKPNTIVSIGIPEKYRFSTATLVLNHHRKLMPTFFEKLVWAAGDGHGLRVSKTAQGNIGNLICGENTNPLARYTLMAQAEQIHISTWPAIWPTRAPTDPGGANYDNVVANRIRAAAHCFEAKCFGVLCAGFLDSNTDTAAIKMMTEGASAPHAVKDASRNSSRGASMFLDPTGPAHPAFIFSEDGKKEAREFLQDEEGILYADFELDRCVEGKQYHDVVGGYQRLDVFHLQVNRKRADPMVFRGEVLTSEGDTFQGSEKLWTLGCRI